jgi:hypothetical protein
MPREATPQGYGWGQVDHAALRSDAQYKARKLREAGDKARIRWDGSGYAVEVRDARFAAEED